MIQRHKPENVEQRSYPIEMRAAKRDSGADGQQQVTLTGYAAVFNSVTVLLPADSWYKGSPEIREIIEPGAFAKTITEFDQRAVWNHNTDFVLGRRGNKTLRLWEDQKGLGNEIIPPDTDLIRDMAIAPIERGDVNQMSFAFRIIRESVTEEDNVIEIRLKEVELIEVSPCTIPAYADTSISARSQSRIEDFRQKRQSAIQAAPVDSDHPAPVATPTAEHPEDSAPLDMRHLDERLRMELEIELAA